MKRVSDEKLEELIYNFRLSSNAYISALKELKERRKQDKQDKQEATLPPGLEMRKKKYKKLYVPNFPKVVNENKICRGPLGYGGCKIKVRHNKCIHCSKECLYGPGNEKKYEAWIKELSEEK